MVWFRACNFLVFALLTAIGGAESQIQEPLGTIFAEHSTVATDTGHTAASRSPIIRKPLPSGIHSMSPHTTVFTLLTLQISLAFMKAGPNGSGWKEAIA